MPIFSDPGARVLKCLFLALAVLFAQQVAQLHSLAHAQDQLAQSKGKPISHKAEQCLALHAIDSALVTAAAPQHFDLLQADSPNWIPTSAQARAVYRLPSRAPPHAV